MDITEKKCTCCLLLKPITDFYRDSKTRDGYHTQCKMCKTKKERELINRNISNPLTITYKTCSVCKHTKSVDDFHKKSGSKDGYRAVCKPCRSKTEINCLDINILQSNMCMCNRCKTSKILYDFRVNKYTDNGFSSICTNCISELPKYLKYCNKCDNVLDIGCYYKDSSNQVDGLYTVCKYCSMDKYHKNVMESLNAVKLKGFQPGNRTLYIISLDNGVDKLFKIGLTDVTTNVRCKSFMASGFKHSILGEFFLNKEYASYLEYMLLNEHRNNNLQFDFKGLRFDGYTECIKDLNINILEKYLKDLPNYNKLIENIKEYNEQKTNSN